MRICYIFCNFAANMEHVYHIPEQKEKETSVFYTTIIKHMKVLVATEKPFAKVAVDGIMLVQL